MVADAALASGWDDVVFYDQEWPRHHKNGRWPVVGNTESFHQSCLNYDGVIVAIGNSQIRFDESSRIRSADAPLCTIIHPAATLSSFAEVGVGVVILAGAIINVDAFIGFASIVNVGATVDHDCVLAESVHVAPGANLSGNITVGPCTWIGVGSTIRQGLTIGHHVMVGAGAVVVSDVPDNTTVVGNPAKVLQR